MPIDPSELTKSIGAVWAGVAESGQQPERNERE
jgi:hypothetical protein